MDMNLVLARAQNAVLSHDWTTAARLYKELLRGEESNIEYLKELGSIYVKAGDDEKAIPYYEQIITLYPHTVDAMNSLGAIYRRLKQYDKSIDILQKALDEDTDRTSVNYNLGFTYKDMGNFVDAIESFESVIAENPNDVLAYNHLGSIYYNQKIYDRSISSFKRGLQVDPNHPILNYNLARCYEADKNYTEAIRCYEITLKTRPGWTDAIRDFSGLLIKCQYNKKAQALVEKSIKLHPSDVELLCILGRIFINQFDYDNATNTYKKAKNIKGNDIDVLMGFSEALEKGAKPEQALEIALEAMEIDPYSKDVRKRYSSTLLSNQRYDQAYENIISLAKETEEKDAQVLDLCAQYYLCRGDEVLAKNYHDKIQAVNHHYKDYLLNASARCVQIGELEKAEKYAQQYVERRPQLPNGYNQLGIIYQKKGDIEASSKYFEKSKSCCDSNVFAENALKAAAEYKKEFVLSDSEVAESENEENIVQQEEAVENQTVEQNIAQEEEEPFEFSAFGDKLNAETLAEDNDNFWDEFDDDSEKTELPLSDEEHFTDSEDMENDEFNKDIFDTIDGADSIKDKLSAEDEEDFSISSLAGNSEPDEIVSDEIQNEAPAMDEPYEETPVTETPVSEEPVMPVNSVPAPVPVEQSYQSEAAVKYADKAMDAAFIAQKMVQQLSEQQRSFEQALEMRNEQRIHEEVEKAVESKLQSSMDSQMEKIMSAEEEFGDVEEFTADETETFGDVEDFAADEPEAKTEVEVEAETADEFDSFGTVEEFAGEEAEPVEIENPTEEVEVSSAAVTEEMATEEAYEEDEFCRVEDLIGEEAEPTDNPYEEADEFDDVSVFAVPEEQYDEDYGTAETEEEDHFAGVEELIRDQPEFGPEDDFDEVEDFMGEEAAGEAEPETETESNEEIAEDVPAADYEEDDFTVVDEYADDEVAETTETEITEPEVADAEAESSAAIEEDIVIPEIELPKGEVDQLELFKTLRVLSNFLPEKEKNSFLSCRIRMMIEYIIAKMSGKPGLLITAKTLLESGALGEEYDAQLTAEAEDDVSNAMITHVLKYMKKLAESLQDSNLSNALCISADNILERIELEDQKSQIF